jgi:hypothetical protein
MVEGIILVLALPGSYKSTLSPIPLSRGIMNTSGLAPMSFTTGLLRLAPSFPLCSLPAATGCVLVLVDLALTALRVLGATEGGGVVVIGTSVGLALNT